MDRSTPRYSEAGRDSPREPSTLARCLWPPAGALALAWYFLGYLRSLDAYLAVSDRWPALKAWLDLALP